MGRCLNAGCLLRFTLILSAPNFRLHVSSAVYVKLKDWLKLCRSRWGGSLWAASSGSTQFAKAYYYRPLLPRHSIRLSVIPPSDRRYLVDAIPLTGNFAAFLSWSEDILVLLIYLWNYFCHFFSGFELSHFKSSNSIVSGYLGDATPPTVVDSSFWNFVGVFCRCQKIWMGVWYTPKISLSFFFNLVIFRATSLPKH